MIKTAAKASLCMLVVGVIFWFVFRPIEHQVVTEVVSNLGEK